MIENTVGIVGLSLKKKRKKKTKRLLGAISPFLKVLSNGLYCMHVKTRACLGKD